MKRKQKTLRDKIWDAISNDKDREISEHNNAISLRTRDAILAKYPTLNGEWDRIWRIIRRHVPDNFYEKAALVDSLCLERLNHREERRPADEDIELVVLDYLTNPNNKIEVLPLRENWIPENLMEMIK